MANPRIIPEPRYCVVCGKEIEFRADDCSATYSKRQYCRPTNGENRSQCYGKPKAGSSRERDRVTCKNVFATIEPYKPRPRKLFLTDAEQAKIDRECLARDAAKMGLTKDTGRSLSREEIDALWNAGEITPIDQIPDRVLSDVDYPGLVQSWCDAGARRWVRG